METAFHEIESVGDIPICEKGFTNPIEASGPLWCRNNGSEAARLLEELRENEAQLCREDPVYFVENYCHIEDKDAPQLIVPFKLWPGQKNALRDFAEYRLNVVLKARQLGFTWLALAEACRLMVLNSGRTVIGLSRSEDEAKELVRRLGVILRYMPEFVAESGSVPAGWSGPVFESTSLSLTIHFRGKPDSVFRGFASSPSVGRSFTADLILIDEWAFQQFADEIWQSAFPIVNRPLGGRVIGLSTIKRGTLFEEIFTNPDNGFHKIFLPWSADPRRDEKWYRETLGALGEDKTMEEYPATVEQALTVPGGAFFPEMLDASHKAQALPEKPGRRYVTMDYGLDMLSAHWIDIDAAGHAVVYREYNAPDKNIGQAAEVILRLSEGENIELFLAPPDLWSRSQESGKSRAQLFHEAELDLTQSSRDFAAGCAAMKEWLSTDPATGTPWMQFYNCPTLYRHLQKIQKDEKNPDVYAKQPHNLTHAPDSLRYFCVWWSSPASVGGEKKRAVWEPDLYEDYENADEAGKEHLLQTYGDPF